MMVEAQAEVAQCGTPALCRLCGALLHCLVHCLLRARCSEHRRFHERSSRIREYERKTDAAPAGVRCCNRRCALLQTVRRCGVSPGMHQEETVPVCTRAHSAHSLTLGVCEMNTAGRAGSAMPTVAFVGIAFHLFQVC